MCVVHGFLERTDLPLHEGPVPNICMEFSFSTVICRDFAYFRDLPTQQAMGKLPDNTLLAMAFTCQGRWQSSFSPASRGKLRSLVGGTLEPGLSVGALGGKAVGSFSTHWVCQAPARGDTNGRGEGWVRAQVGLILQLCLSHPILECGAQLLL